VDHDERLRLAADLTERLLDRHRAAIVAVGVHGAAARGEDGAESDLDLAVVTVGPEAEVPDRYLRHRGIVVDLGAIAADAYLEEAGHIGPAWPLASDQYVNQLAIHDPGGYFHKLQHVHQAAVEEAGPEVFAAAAGVDLVQLLSWDATARAAELAGDLLTTQVAVKEAAVLAALVIGLHTRTPPRPPRPPAPASPRPTGACSTPPPSRPSGSWPSAGPATPCVPWPTARASPTGRTTWTRSCSQSVLAGGSSWGGGGPGSSSAATSSSSTRRPWR
jgi:hypothetical protein